MAPITAELYTDYECPHCATVFMGVIPEFVRDYVKTGKVRFIHRDFHPSNLLWQNGQVSGVVDWVNGCRGPAGIDVAWCRHNLANLHGVAVADDFLGAYIEAAGSEFDYDPHWDLMTVVELLPGPPRMYDGWRASGIAPISSAIMRERVDAYIASVVARLD